MKKLNKSELAIILEKRETGEMAGLSNTDLSGLDLSGLDLSNSDLSHSDLSDSDLRDSDFRDANLTSTSLPDSSWVILGEPYFIFIHDGFLRAGCECHGIDSWRRFSVNDILEMGGEKAVSFYPRLLKIIDFYCGEEK